MSDKNQDLFSHVTIPSLHVDIEDLTPKDYQIKEVFLGKPSMDIAELMVTTRIKEVFRHLEHDEFEVLKL